MKLIAIAIVIIAIFGGTNLIYGQAYGFPSAQSVTVTNSTVYQIMQRAYEIVVGIAALLIAILWVPIAIGYFSRDLDRKADAKERTKDALIGTIIFIMAITGILYGVIHYIVVG